MTGGSLLERAADLRQGVDELEQLRGMAEQAQAFASRADMLTTPAEELEVMSFLAQMFGKRGAIVHVDRDRCSGLRALVKRMAEAYAEKPESILVSDGQLRFGFWDTLEQLPKQVRGELLAAWAAFVEEKLPLRQDGLLQTLRRLPGAAGQVEQVELLWKRAEALKGRIPTEETDFEKPRRLAEEIQTAMDTLTGGSLPEEVQLFIQAATSAGGATLDLFSPAVRDWLARTENLASVRVVLRTGS